jgi:hypothetical protein
MAKGMVNNHRVGGCGVEEAACSVGGEVQHFWTIVGTAVGHLLPKHLQQQNARSASDVVEGGTLRAMAIF